MIRMIIIYMSGQQSTERSYSYRISLISPARGLIFSVNQTTHGEIEGAN